VMKTFARAYLAPAQESAPQPAPVMAAE
jgi:hypothetical protein